MRPQSSTLMPSRPPYESCVFRRFAQYAFFLTLTAFAERRSFSVGVGPARGKNGCAVIRVTACGSSCASQFREYLRYRRLF